MKRKNKQPKLTVDHRVQGWEDFVSLLPCREGLDYVARQHDTNLRRAWRKTPHACWMLWLTRRVLDRYADATASPVSRRRYLELKGKREALLTATLRGHPMTRRSLQAEVRKVIPESLIFAPRAFRK